MKMIPVGNLNVHKGKALEIEITKVNIKTCFLILISLKDYQLFETKIRAMYCRNVNIHKNEIC